MNFVNPLKLYYVNISEALRVAETQKVHKMELKIFETQILDFTNNFPSVQSLKTVFRVSRSKNHFPSGKSQKAIFRTARSSKPFSVKRANFLTKKTTNYVFSPLNLSWLNYKQN